MYIYSYPNNNPMKPRFLTVVFLLLISWVSVSQNPNLCAGLIDYIIIENTNHVPSINENTEDGSLILTFNQQYISDLFANYTIYDFYQSFPSGSEETQKYYTIAYSSRDLMNDINTQIPTNILVVDNIYSSTSLSPSIISFLNNKQFRYSKYCSDVPEVGEECSDNEMVLNSDFNVLVSFSYDSSNDVLTMQSDGLTPCQNAFSISFKGGVDSNDIQIWEIQLGTIAENPSCDYAETFFNNMLNIGCFPGSHYGDISFLIDTSENTIKLGRNTLVFSYDYITLDFQTLSNKSFNLENIKLITAPDAPYITFSNLNNKVYHIEVFDISGKQILPKTGFNNHTISTEYFSKGLYFIKLYSDSYNKTFKFLNN